MTTHGPVVFYGDLINPGSLKSLRLHRRSLLAVNTSGCIDWIIENIVESEIQKVLDDHSYRGVEIIILKPGQFIVPGFVDTHTVSFMHLSCMVVGIDSISSMHRKSQTWEGILSFLFSINDDCVYIRY